jgi:hypothetical protein
MTNKIKVWPGAGRSKQEMKRQAKVLLDLTNDPEFHPWYLYLVQGGRAFLRSTWEEAVHGVSPLETDPELVKLDVPDGWYLWLGGWIGPFAHSEQAKQHRLLYYRHYKKAGVTID